MRSWLDSAPALLVTLLAAACSVAPARAQGPRMIAETGPVEVTGLRLPDYHSDGTLKSELFGDTAIFDGDLITVRNLRVEVYEAGRLATSFWGESCRYDRATGKVTSDSPVRVIRAGLLITGEGLDWKRGETTVTIRRKVRVTTVRSMGWMNVEKRP